MRALRPHALASPGSFLFRRDARAKLAALFSLLIALSISRSAFRPTLAVLAFLLAAAALARVSVLALCARAALVLPFCIVFAAVIALTGEFRAAGSLLLRTYVSGFAAALFIATTPVPSWVDALGRLRVPAFLLNVVQLVYRYLFVLAEDARQAWTAGLCRGGFHRYRGFAAAGGVVAALFLQSHARASNIHHAMISRGYSGSLPTLIEPRFQFADFLLTAAGAAAAFLSVSIGERGFWR